MQRRDLLRAALGAAMPIAAGRCADAATPPTPRRKPTGSGPVLVIDPGHGGRDPGAVGAAGTLEKHVVLDVAAAMARRLGGQATVHLTRTDDTFLPLDERRARGQELSAALFVSIHADSAPNRDARGLSAYVLSDTASDELARAVAETENRADRFAVGDRPLPPRVAAILRDFARHETQARATRARSQIVEGAGRSLPLLENPKRSANFAVLRAADVPSILIEIGFLSNPADERRLGRADERLRIATVLAGEIGRVLGRADAV